jgi:hypothetical protein
MRHRRKNDKMINEKIIKTLPILNNGLDCHFVEDG